MTSIQIIASRLPYDRGVGFVSMFDNGEAVLGLEMIIDNLYEFDITISQVESDLLYKLAADYNLDAKFVDMLRDVPVERL